MIASLRWIAPLTALPALSLAFLVARPDWLYRGPASPPMSVVLSGPDEKSQIVQGRLAARTKVVERLLAHQLTLIEAAAWFRELNDNPPNLRCDYRNNYPGDSDGEKLCRQVIHWAEIHLNGTRTPSEVQEVVAGLWDELDRLLCQGGPVELPW
jgi:hypothetical protein